jgi:hypothetical protein
MLADQTAARRDGAEQTGDTFCGEQTGDTDRCEQTGDTVNS